MRASHFALTNLNEIDDILGIYITIGFKYHIRIENYSIGISTILGYNEVVGVLVLVVDNHKLFLLSFA
jgi:hypothetical protein